jgi:hypothetical protein
VNGGLAGAVVGVMNVGERVERIDGESRIAPAKRCKIGARLRVTRERHPAVAISPKAVRWSRDRGCKGHRIL